MRFRFHPSRLLTLLIVLAHVGAAFSILFVPTPWLQWVLITVLLTNLGFQLGRIWRSTEGVTAILIQEEVVSLELANGMLEEGQLLPGGVVTPWLVVLRFRAEGRWRSRNVLLLPDSLETEDFRRLRVWLKWKNFRVLP